MLFLIIANYFSFFFFFCIYARKKQQKAILPSASVTLVAGVELKYERVKSIEVEVLGLGFMGFAEVCLLPVL